MKIYDQFKIVKSKDGTVWSTIEGKWKTYTGDIANQLKYIVTLYRRKYNVTGQIERLKAMLGMNTASTNNETNEKSTDINVTLTKLIDFFTEFSFEPNFRFVNTLAHHSKKLSCMQAYVTNYFKLTDNGYAQAIEEKMKSSEFKDIYDDFTRIDVKTTINNRFRLYYGSQGTGKTTQAMAEADNNVMVCHSAMLPSDLMEDFKFNDGKAAFTPSALCNAMTEGKAIVLDEINLLPFESLRFLQTILDNKSQIIYKGQTINIKDGFKIIGTMNLQVNGMTYSLPEPLVDRAEELKQFKLTAEHLKTALM